MGDDEYWSSKTFHQQSSRSVTSHSVSELSNKNSKDNGKSFKDRKAKGDKSAGRLADTKTNNNNKKRRKSLSPKERKEEKKEKRRKSAEKNINADEGAKKKWDWESEDSSSESSSDGILTEDLLDSSDEEATGVTKKKNADGAKTDSKDAGGNEKPSSTADAAATGDVGSDDVNKVKNEEATSTSIDNEKKNEGGKNEKQPNVAESNQATESTSDAQQQQEAKKSTTAEEIPKILVVDTTSSATSNVDVSSGTIKKKKLKFSYAFKLEKLVEYKQHPLLLACASNRYRVAAELLTRHMGISFFSSDKFALKERATLETTSLEQQENGASIISTTTNTNRGKNNTPPFVSMLLDVEQYLVFRHYVHCRGWARKNFITSSNFSSSNYDLPKKNISKIKFLWRKQNFRYATSRQQCKK